MFGSSLIDVLLGVVFIFLAVSLAASAITEAIAALLRLRAATLMQGVQNLVNDPSFSGLAKSLYAHALINPLSVGSSLTARPAYIKGQAFALALVDVLQSEQKQKPLVQIVDEIADPQLRQTLTLLLSRAQGDVLQFQAGVAAWFDGAMGQVSGVYKRKTQLIGFLAALAVAGLLNADPLHAGGVLWSRPALTASLTAVSAHDAQATTKLIDQLATAGLIGWDGWGSDSRNCRASGLAETVLPGCGSGLAVMLLGWLIAAAASLFGAPFWFDTLQRITDIRSTGAKPAASVKPAGAQADAGSA